MIKPIDSKQKFPLWTWLSTQTLCCFLAATLIVLMMGSQARAQLMEDAVRGLSLTLREQVNCNDGNSARVGIFPFEETSLPISPQSAFSLYEVFLGDLINRAPSCVEFIDGRGAFVTLNYLGNSGTLQESGQQQRQQIQSSLEAVDYTLDGTILSTDHTLSAVFRLTDMTNGVAVGRVTFDVPASYSSTGCGDGALPLNAALTRIAEALSNKVGSLESVVATGGKYASTDTVTDAGAYIEDQLLSELSKSVENAITGAALRVQRLSANETPKQQEVGEHALLLTYWICEGDQTGRLSATLRSSDGLDTNESININFSTIPSGLNLRLSSRDEVDGTLIVSPTIAAVGTEVSLIADPPAYCDPFFLSIAPSNKITPIPLEFFKQVSLGNGRTRYEISPQWNFGLIVQEGDEAGLNQLGYLCQPSEIDGVAGLQGLMRKLLEVRTQSSEGVLEVLDMKPIYYQLTGFEIVL